MLLFSTQSLRSLPRILRRLLQAGVLASTFALTGCSLLPEQIDMTKDWSAQRFYSEARAAMMDGDYEKSIDYYEKLQARFPYGVQAQQAQVDIIYAYYKYNEEESAIAAADRFIKLHPRHPNVDYVYYMRGLVRYNQGQDLLSKLVPQEPSERDPKSMREAFQYFSELVEKFPASKYAEDARARLVFTRNALAMHEVHVARFYMSREAWVAAAGRANTVIENYQRTKAVKEALQILVEAYDKMGMPELAEDARRVYQMNYGNES